MSGTGPGEPRPRPRVETEAPSGAGGLGEERDTTEMRPVGRPLPPGVETQEISGAGGPAERSGAREIRPGDRPPSPRIETEAASGAEGTGEERDVSGPYPSERRPLPRLEMEAPDTVDPRSKGGVGRGQPVTRRPTPIVETEKLSGSGVPGRGRNVSGTNGRRPPPGLAVQELPDAALAAKGRDVSQTRPDERWPAPRIETEELPASRLESALPVIELAVPPRRQWGMPALVFGGASVLVLGAAGLETFELVAETFARSGLLGGAAAGVAGVGFSMIGLGFWREWAALSALRGVDRLRAALSGQDAVARARAAREWLRELPEGPALLPAVNAVNDPDAILALLRAGPVASLRGQADALGRAAALQSMAGIAAMPSPGLAALFVAWRGLRLVRQIAQLHGLRPGALATLGLLRRTALSAGAVAGVEVATNTAAHALLSSPLLTHVAGEMAGAGVAARRMLVLARAASVACSPVPPE